MEYAAVVIPTLSRYEHFVRCIDSLKRNKCADKTDIYIALDKTFDKKHEAGRKKIEEYLDHGIDGFAHVYVHKHDSNQGAKENIEYVIRWALETHNKFVFSEDDNEFSPNYLEYVNYLLDIFEDDKDTIAVSGYNYPMNIDEIQGEYFYSNTYFAAFGFASWSRKFNAMRENMTAEWLNGFYKDNRKMKALCKAAPNQYCNFVKGMLGYTDLIEKDGIVWKMDLTYGLFMFSNNKKMIFPVIPKVRNWGYDGSGVNCDVMSYDRKKPITHRNFDFSCQRLDIRDTCEEIEYVSDINNVSLNRRVNEFFDIPIKELIRTKIAYCISRIVGVNSIRKIWNR